MNIPVVSDYDFIFRKLENCFSFDAKLLQVVIPQIVEQASNMKLNKLTIQPIFKQIRKSCPKKELSEMNVLFKCCYVLLLSLRENFLMFESEAELLQHYPEFVGLPLDETRKLLVFRNMMKIALQLIDAKGHKGELLEIAGRLSGRVVTTGGSQTTETKRRVLVYEREGELELETSVGAKRKAETVLKPESLNVEAALLPLPNIDPPASVFGRPVERSSDSQATLSLSSTEKRQAVTTVMMVKTEPNGEPHPVELQLPMPVVLFLAQQLKNKFNVADAANYQAIIERTIIETSGNRELNRMTMRSIMKDLRKLFPKKEIWDEMNVLYKCCFVLILSLHDSSQLWLEPAQLVENYPYPQFQNLRPEDAMKLLAFRNAMKVALQLVEAKHHKGELLEIAGRLSGRTVTTGGGQTADTTRCVMIYEKEGGLPVSLPGVVLPQPRTGNANLSGTATLRKSQAIPAPQVGMVVRSASSHEFMATLSDLSFDLAGDELFRNVSCGSYNNDERNCFNVPFSQNDEFCFSRMGSLGPDVAYEQAIGSFSNGVDGRAENAGALFTTPAPSAPTTLCGEAVPPFVTATAGKSSPWNGNGNTSSGNSARTGVTTELDTELDSSEFTNDDDDVDTVVDEEEEEEEEVGNLLEDDAVTHNKRDGLDYQIPFSSQIADPADTSTGTPLFRAQNSLYLAEDCFFRP
jgi:hypothetical protein